MMEGLVLDIIESEIIPLIAMGIVSGFALGTLFALAAWGIFKSVSLLNIKNI